MQRERGAIGGGGGARARRPRVLLPGSRLRWQDSGHVSQVYLSPTLGFSTLLPIGVTGWQTAAGHVTQRSEALNNASLARFYPLVEENGAESEHSLRVKISSPLSIFQTSRPVSETHF